MNNDENPKSRLLGPRDSNSAPVPIFDAVFDQRYVKFQFTTALLAIVIFPPLWILLPLLPLIYLSIKATYNSLKLKIYDDSIVYEQGNFSCFVCCWNASERIVPLEKITDVTWRQSWWQRVFGLETLAIRTASGSFGEEGASAGADIVLVGAVDSKQLRDVIMSAKVDKERQHGGLDCGTGSVLRAKRPDAAALPSAALDVAKLADVMERQLDVLSRIEQGLGATSSKQAAP